MLQTSFMILLAKIISNVNLTNSFPMHPFSTPWKHRSENLAIFWCFQGIEKECIGNEWVKDVNYSRKGLILDTWLGSGGASGNWYINWYLKFKHYSSWYSKKDIERWKTSKDGIILINYFLLKFIPYVDH